MSKNQQIVTVHSMKARSRAFFGVTRGQIEEKVNEKESDILCFKQPCTYELTKDLSKKFHKSQDLIKILDEISKIKICHKYI